MAWAWVGVEILTRATAGGTWGKFGMEVPHTSRKVTDYIVGVSGGRCVCVSGRGNIDPGNRWRKLDQIWHGGSPHIPEGYRLCGYVVGVA